MDWRCGSSGREPILQEQSPEFKSHQKKKGKFQNNIAFSDSGDIIKD
jgi:hypothetical protein